MRRLAEAKKLDLATFREVMQIKVVNRRLSITYRRL